MADAQKLWVGSIIVAMALPLVIYTFHSIGLLPDKWGTLKPGA
jgi:hypothetical protein